MTLEDLRMALTEGLVRFRLNPYDHILTEEEFARYRGLTPRSDESVHVLLFTPDHSYHLHVTKSEDDRWYFGPNVSCRKQRTGENWLRGGDMCDCGVSTRAEFDEAWGNFMYNILRYEFERPTDAALDRWRGIERGLVDDSPPKS